jgi:hypothetical protein
VKPCAEEQGTAIDRRCTDNRMFNSGSESLPQAVLLPRSLGKHQCTSAVQRTLTLYQNHSQYPVDTGKKQPGVTANERGATVSLRVQLYCMMGCPGCQCMAGTQVWLGCGPHAPSSCSCREKRQPQSAPGKQQQGNSSNLGRPPRMNYGDL